MRNGWWALVVVAACGSQAIDPPDVPLPVEERVTDTAVADTASAEAPPTEPDRDNVRACILETWLKRTCTGCHFGGNHLDLRRDPLDVLRTKTREEVPGAPLLVPGDPDASLVVRKLEARAGLIELEPGEGDPMPPDREIDVDDAALMRAWVAAGARDCAGG